MPLSNHCADRLVTDPEVSGQRPLTLCRGEVANSRLLLGRELARGRDSAGFVVLDGEQDRKTWASQCGT